MLAKAIMLHECEEPNYYLVASAFQRQLLKTPIGFREYSILVAHAVLDFYLELASSFYTICQPTVPASRASVPRV